MINLDKAVTLRIEALRRAPLMFAYTREAFVAQLVLLLDLLDLDGRLLYKEFFSEKDTCRVVNLSVTLDEIFVRDVFVRVDYLLGAPDAN